MYFKDNIEHLEKIAHRIRVDIIEMARKSGKCHFGGALSIVEILVALYFCIMSVDPKNPKWPDRDRFILSKGHATATWYAVLAEKGFFPKEILFTQFIKLNGLLQGHPCMIKTPGVDMSSGSLGQGLSVGLGMSLANRLNNKKYKVYVLLGDGEIQSGQIWEAVMASYHYKANNITAIVDCNKLQVGDLVRNEINIEPVGEKFQAFGWNVLEIDGNNMSQVVKALKTIKQSSSFYPTVIISHTIKGKGISFMEGNINWHSHEFPEELYKRAKKELCGGSS